MHQEFSPSTAVATLVIPQYGNTELTLQCLQGLRKYDTREWPIVIVSDGCEEAELSKLRSGIQNELDVKIIKQPHRGVSASWNVGISIAETEYVVLLNNDVLCTGDWGRSFLSPLRSGDSWISGVNIRRENELIRLGMSTDEEAYLFEGWCFGLAKKTWNDLGGFDESMSTYWSDTDFQWRGKIHYDQTDWLRKGFVSDLPLRHLGHRTAHRSSVISASRRIWFADRNVFRNKWSIGALRGDLEPRRSDA